MEAWPGSLNNWQGLMVDCMWEVRDIVSKALIKVGKGHKEGRCLWREMMQRPS